MIMAQVGNENPVVNPKVVVDSFVMTQRDEEIVSFCKDIGTFDSFVQGFNAYSPIGVVMERLGYRWNSKTNKYNAPVSVTNSIKTRVLVPPKHGKLAITFAHTWAYRADSGYEGKDQVVYLVEVAGRRFRVISNLLVREGANEFESECDKVFPKGVVPSSLHFAPLGDATLAQTIGSGRDVSVTLDVTAAGHSWYLDPTSNPNEWIAKSGSDAAGKMDMLSVLLHEYGHAHALVLAGRLRGTRYGAWNIDPRGVKLVPQYDIAANPQLANADDRSTFLWDGRFRYTPGAEGKERCCA